MNLYLRELRANMKSTIIWAIVLILLIFMGMSEFTAASGSMDFNALLENLPKSIQNIFGVGVLNYNNFLDYFAVLFLYIILTIGIHSIMLGCGMIAKEERDKTVEFLNVKPISRNKIITFKLLSSLTIMIILNVTSFITSYLSADESSKGNKTFYLLFLLLFIFQILLLSLGMLIASIFKNNKYSYSLSNALILSMFGISIIIDMSGRLDFLRYITFFKYYDAIDIIKDNYNYLYVYISIIIIIISIILTYFFYNKRDLKI